MYFVTISSGGDSLCGLVSDLVVRIAVVVGGKPQLYRLPVLSQLLEVSNSSKFEPDQVPIDSTLKGVTGGYTYAKSKMNSVIT